MRLCFSMLHTLRGSGGDLVICEEFAHMDEKVFKVVVLPTLVTGAAFIGITTLGDDDNFVSHMKRKVNDKGQPIFNFVENDIVCDYCKRAGKATTCKHRLGDIPHWHVESRHKDLEILMRGDTDDYLREVKGFQSSSLVTPVYDVRALENLVSASNTYNCPDTVSHLFVTVDPNAGGSKSKYAVTSCIYHKGNMVIVGCENASYREPVDQMHLLINHIQKAQRINGLAYTKVVFIPESNYAFEGTHQRNVIQSSGLNTITMYEDHNKAGVRTNNDLKKHMSLEFKAKLGARRVFFHKEFFTLTEGYTVERMKSEIFEQLMNFSRKVIPSRNQDRPPTEIYCGKYGYGYDDICIALTLNLVMKRIFYRSDKYAREHVLVNMDID